VETILFSKLEAWSTEPTEKLWLKWVRLVFFALIFLIIWLTPFTLQVMTSYVIIVFHRVIHMQRLPVIQLPALLDMERKVPSRESPRRLSAKPGRGTEMKKLARPLGVVAADSDKDSGFSG